LAQGLYDHSRQAFSPGDLIRIEFADVLDLLRPAGKSGVRPPFGANSGKQIGAKPRMSCCGNLVRPDLDPIVNAEDFMDHQNPHRPSRSIPDKTDETSPPSGACASNRRPFVSGERICRERPAQS